MNSMPHRTKAFHPPLDGATLRGHAVLGRAASGHPKGSQPSSASGFIRIPAPARNERFGWTFERGDRLSFEFDPDAGYGRRYADRVVFAYGGGEVTLLGPCHSDDLHTVAVRLPDGRILPLDALLSDDDTIDRLARSLGGDSGEQT